MIVLRDYQNSCCASVWEAWKDHVSVLAVMATGLGKTVVAANIIKQMHPKRTMFIAHREELIFQAHDKITRAANLNCEIEMADQVAATSLFNREDVVVSTVQTQTAGKGGGRMTRFDPNDFGLLVIDECHHAPASSYKRVIEYYRKNPDLRVLGLTATPKRADEEALGQIFTEVAFNYGILEGVDNGWLVPIEQQLVRVKDLDFTQVRTTAGDLNGGDLARLMESEKPMQGVAGASIEIIGERKALVFTSSVRHAEQVCEIFNRHKSASAEWICGMTEKQKRRGILKKFAAKEFQIICNVGCLTEGFDDPSVEVVIMGRPTKSAALFTQMCGRGTRPLPGIVDGLGSKEERVLAIAASPKPSVLIVDFTGNCGKHKLITTADVLGGNFTEEEKERAKKMIEDSGKPKQMSVVLLDARALIQKEKEEKERREREAAERARLRAKVTYTSRVIDPFNRRDIENYNGGVSRSKDLRQFSPKQTAILRKLGVNPGAVDYRQGQAIIGRHMSQCTEGQAGVLRKHGYSDAEIKKCDRKKASDLIDAIAKNGWRRPSVPQQQNMDRVESMVGGDEPPLDYYDREGQ